MEYRSKAQLLGLPLIHIVTGTPGRGRGVATGWIAVGDIALGVLFAVGGVAVGGFSVGGVSLGLLGFGGVALGFAAVGGFAAGVLALGGAAFGGYAAIGGLAIAGEYAMGGLALAPRLLAPVLPVWKAAGLLPLPVPDWQDLLLLAVAMAALLVLVRAVYRRRLGVAVGKGMESPVRKGD
jgi:hypothetical protein